MLLTCVGIIEYFVDVQDTGRLHVAALNDPDVQNERIIAFAAPFNAKYLPSLLSISRLLPGPKALLSSCAALTLQSDILRILRKLCPGRSKIFPADFVNDNWRDISKVDNERGAELLKRLFRREGWVGLEESVKNNIAGL